MKAPRDPFAPLSAKPLTEEERRKRRVIEGAAHGGKQHRGTRTNANRFLYGHPPKLETVHGRS
jgi:hypothetical protein